MKTKRVFERAVKSVSVHVQSNETLSGKNAALHRKCRALVVQCFANVYFKNRYSVKILSLCSILNIF